MGKFGNLIGQCDSVYDLVENMKEGMDLEDLYRDSGYNPFRGLKDGKGYDMDFALFAISLSVESVNKGSVLAEYYCPRGSDVYTAIKIVPFESISRESVKRSKAALMSLVSIVKANKSHLLSNTFEKGALCVGNKVAFSNAYEYYKAVINNLISGFKNAKSDGADSTKVCTADNEFIWHVYSYELEEDRCSLFDVPSLDDGMLKTGYDKVLLLESDDYSRCHYLSEKLDGFDRPVKDLMVSMFRKHKEQFYSCCSEDAFDSLSAELYDDSIECIFSVSEKDGSITLSNTGLSNDSWYSGEIPSDEFFSETGKYSSLSSIVRKVLEKYTKQGILVDKVTFYVSSHVFTDIDTIEDVLYMEGISRVFESIWWVPENPVPLTKDTYVAILFMGIKSEGNAADIYSCRKCSAHKIRQYLEDGDMCDYLQTILGIYALNEEDAGFDDQFSALLSDLLEELESTPVDKKIYTKGISDEEFYNISKNSRHLLS